MFCRCLRGHSGEREEASEGGEGVDFYSRMRWLGKGGGGREGVCCGGGQISHRCAHNDELGNLCCCA